MKKFVNKRSLIYVGVFVVSAAVSFFGFSATVFQSGALPFIGNKATVADTGQKDKPCPLNGAMHTKTQEDAWNQRRPLAVMIENHTDARPQSGLSTADVVYESVAEGGITRFMAIFLCNDAQDLAPVRSARTYYLDWLSEYDALYSHVGGANAAGPANALGQILEYEIKDVDNFSYAAPTYIRSDDKPAPHNVHTSTEKLWQLASKLGWAAKDDVTDKRWDEGFLPWQFKDDAKDLPAEKKMRVEFWSNQPDYTVDWQYDQKSNSYKRIHSGQVQVDNANKQPVMPKVVVVQFTKESQANDGYPGNIHLIYKTIGSGKALIFQDGKVVEGTWNKQARTGRTKYMDASGAEIKFNRGQIWIQNVPDFADVTY